MRTSRACCPQACWSRCAARPATRGRSRATTPDGGRRGCGARRCGHSASRPARCRLRAAGRRPRSGRPAPARRCAREAYIHRCENRSGRTIRPMPEAVGAGRRKRRGKSRRKRSERPVSAAGTSGQSLFFGVFSAPRPELRRTRRGTHSHSAFLKRESQLFSNLGHLYKYSDLSEPELSINDLKSVISDTPCPGRKGPNPGARKSTARHPPAIRFFHYFLFVKCRKNFIFVRTSVFIYSEPTWEYRSKT